MNVKQLIAALEKEDPNAEVVLSCDEEGNHASVLHRMETCWFSTDDANGTAGDICNLDEQEEVSGREVLCLFPTD